MFCQDLGPTVVELCLHMWRHARSPGCHGRTIPLHIRYINEFSTRGKYVYITKKGSEALNGSMLVCPRARFMTLDFGGYK